MKRGPTKSIPSIDMNNPGISLLNLLIKKEAPSFLLLDSRITKPLIIKNISTALSPLSTMNPSTGISFIAGYILVSIYKPKWATATIIA